MGQMRFHTPDRAKLGSWQAERAYMAGMDGSPWLSHNTYDDHTLTIERGADESGNLFVPWPTEHHGMAVLSTPSLREGNGTYSLPLEIARGTVNRVRCQAADWQHAGLEFNQELHDLIREATGYFVGAATTSQRDPDSAIDDALKAIESASRAIDVLAGHYAEESLAIRRTGANKLSTLLACSLDSLPKFPEIQTQIGQAFNSASIPIRWKDVEPNAGEYQWDTVDQHIRWCQTNGLRVCAGPLVRFDRGSLPDWIYLWEDDFDQLAALLLQFVTNAVNRYRGQVHLWQAASGLNVGGEIALTEEQRLRLAVASLETVRRLDQQTPTVVNFAQPWGEYLATENMELSPLQFADTLLRADLGMAGIGLDINLGYWPNGSLPRHLLDISRLLDTWSTLGVPLLTSLACPSKPDPDPQADERIQIMTERNLQADVAQMIHVMLAKPTVHGIIWNQLTDALPHTYPNAGLYDENFAVKPLLAEIQAIRSQHLM